MAAIVLHFDKYANTTSTVFYSCGTQFEEIPNSVLHASAAKLRVYLRSRGIGVGDVVAIALPTGPIFLALLAAAWSEGCAVSLLPHDVSVSNGRLTPEKFGFMLTALGPKLVVCDAETIVHIQPDMRPRAVIGETLLADIAGIEGVYEPCNIEDKSVAILQFTSGSSGTPRAAVITHAMLAANCIGIQQRVGITSKDRVVSWLPLHHDMGLSAITMSWWAGCDLVLLPTEAYVRQPLNWLDAISKFRGTLSPAPASAYQLVTRFAAALPKRKLDLSSWRYAWAGAEPVFDLHLRNFTRAMSPYGLSSNVVQPAYGMAESVVAVTLNPPGSAYSVCHVDRQLLGRIGVAKDVERDVPQAIAIASNGKPIDGVEVRVINQENATLSDSHEGEIQIRGTSVMQRYWNQSPCEISLDGWYSTGDIGFIRNGEVYVSGRSKDVITRAGLNISPNGIEWAIEDLLGSRPGSTAAFSYIDAMSASERVVAVVAGANATATHIRSSIAQTVAEKTGIQLDDIVFVRHTDLPRTTSGKIQRNELRRRYSLEKASGGSTSTEVLCTEVSTKDSMIAGSAANA